MLETIAISYIVLAIVATVVVIRSKHLERSQAILQSCLVWLLPFVGAAFVLVFHTVVHTNMTTKAKRHRASNNSDESVADDLY